MDSLISYLNEGKFALTQLSSFTELHWAAPGKDKKKPKVSLELPVENIGVEPMTSCMPCKRSSQLS